MTLDKACAKFAKRLVVDPGKSPRLGERDPGEDFGIDDVGAADRRQDENVQRIARLADRLWAEREAAVLVVLQGMDTAGKDGTIRHLLTGVNPQLCRVANFKAPTPEELDHDFLWRVHARCPARGELGVFNRSHYEDIVTVRVKKLAPQKVWSARYGHVRAFERMLADSGTVVLKFFLHISKAEQRRRLQERIDDPGKNWKMNPADLAERERWDAYMEAYGEALGETSARHAPWYVVPGDKKWLRNLAVSQIVADALEELGPRYPEPPPGVKGLKVR